jgi:serralysin
VTVGSFVASDFQLQIDYAKLGATFADEFNKPISLYDPVYNPNGFWRPDYGGNGLAPYTLVGNSEDQIYTSPYFRGHPGDFSESPFTNNADGTLTITARASTNPEIFGYDYTSGAITTKGSFSQLYGYFEMKASVPSAAGAWPAFWLLPADGSWPPELDVMEILGDSPQTVYQSWHSYSGQQTAVAFAPQTVDGMHTYGVLWSPTELIWYLDGVETLRAPTPTDMNKPMFMIANMAMGGGWAGAVDPAALPADMKIDYIHAYALPANWQSIFGP